MKNNYFLSWITAVLFLLSASFATAQITVFEEGFESGFPADWTQDTVSGSNGWSVQTGANLTYPTGAQSGSGRAYFTTNNNNPSVVKLVSLEVDASGLTEPVLVFHYASVAYPGPPARYDSLRVYTRASAGAAWQFLKAYGRADFWTADTLSLTGRTSNSFQVAFEGIDRSGHGIVLDNISIGNRYACVTPTNLRTLNLTHNSARLVWTATDVASYSIKVHTSPITDFTQTALFEDTVHFISNYIRTELSSSTTYYFYVKSDCGNGDESAWSAAGTFTTACEPLAVLNEDFESYYSIGTSPPATASGGFGCWSVIARGVGITIGNGHYPYVYDSGTYAHSGTKSLNLRAIYTAETDDLGNSGYTMSYAVSPRLADTINLAEKQLTFRIYAQNTTSKLYVGVADYADDMSTFTEIQTVSVKSPTDKEEVSVYLNEYTGSGKYIVFYISGIDISENTYLMGTNIWIDDVKLEPLAACENTKISNIVSIPSETSASIQWNGVNSSAFNLKVSSMPINPATTAADIRDLSSLTQSTYSLTGLHPASAYYIYIQPVCGGVAGSWSDGQLFRTACPANGLSDFPYTENFDTYGTGKGVYPSCWSRLGVWIADGYPNIISSPYNTLPGSLNIYAAPSSSSSLWWSMAISPKLNVRMDTMQVVFNGFGANAAARLQVGVMSDPDNFATFVPVQTIAADATNTWQGFTISFENYTGDGQYIAFYSDTYSFLVDDLTIERVPACKAPVSLRSTENSENSVSLAWNSSPDGETAWQIAYGISGFDPDLSTPVALSDSVYTVPDLNHNTYYDFYVRANCGGSDGVSPWRGPLTVNTKQIPAGLPYSCDFETESISGEWTLENGAQPNQWIVGSATNNGGGKSLYISSDDGQTNGYENFISYTYAYRTFNLGAGYHDIAFDWKAAGQTTYDLLNVFLVPDSVYLKAGNNYGMGIDPIWGSSINTTPVGWINVSNGKLNMSGTEWNTLNDRVTVPAAGKYHLTFLWKNDDATRTLPAAAVDNITVSQDSSCITPLNVAIKQIADNSSVLGFTSYDANDGGSWKLKVSTGAISLAEIDGITANVLDSVITSKTFRIERLEPLTTYYYYLKSICDTVWLSGSFTTRCARVDIPYAESFETYGTNSTAAYPSCWSKLNSVNASLYVASVNFNPPGSLYFNANATNYAMAITPLLNVGSLNKVSLSFKGQATTYDSRLQVGVISDPDDISTFVPFDTISPSATNNWEDFEIYFDDYSGDGKHIAFLSATGTSDRYYIDNVLIDTVPYNRKPTDLKAINITPASATLTWKGYEAVSFKLKVSSSPLSVNDNSAADIFDGTVTDASRSLTGLKYATKYYFYVQGIYDNAVTSEWSGEGSFRSGCLDVWNLPLRESFDDYGTVNTGINTSFPDCWFRLQTQSSTVWPYIFTTYSSAPGALYFNNYAGSYSMAISPALNFDQEKGLRISFKGRKTAAAYMLVVGMIPDPANAATFVPIDTVSPATNNVWEDFEVLVDATVYTGNAKHVAFLSPGDATNIFFLDDVLIEPAVITCPAPADIRANRIEHNSARIAWNDNGVLPEFFRMKVSSVPIDPEQQGNDAVLIDSIYDNYYYLTGLLAPSTRYYVYVQAVCGEDDLSFWSEELAFNTGCVPASLPFADNFDTYSGGSFPGCWTAGVQVSGTVSAANQYQPYVSRNGEDGAMYLTAYYSSGNYTEADIITPQLDVDSIQKCQLSFRFSATTAGVNSLLYVGVMSDRSDPSTFVPVDIFFNEGQTNVYTSAVVNFSDYAGTGKYVAFRINGGDVQAYYTMLIDDVHISLIPECAAPHRIRVKSEAGNPVFVEWQAGNNLNAAWEYAVTDTLILLSSDNAAAEIENRKVAYGTVTTASCTIGNLQSNAVYYFYIKSSCGAYYPDAVSFTTACDPVELPYFENFDNYGTGTGGGMYNPFPSCWTRLQNLSSTIGQPYLVTGNYISEPAAMYFNISGSDTEAYIMAVSPEINTESLNNVQLRFMARFTYSQRVLIVGALPNPNDTAGFVPVDTIQRSSSAFTEYTVSFGNYTGNARHIAILCPSGTQWGITANTCWVDNVVIETIPACKLLPSGFTVTARTENSVSLSWTPGGDETAWEIAYGELGFNPVSATPIPVSDTFHTVPGLDEKTAYDFYVRANCGGADSTGSWRGPLTETTRQIPAVLPYLCDFETDSISAKWTLENTRQQNQWCVGSAVANGGTKSLYISDNKGISNNYSSGLASYVYAYRVLNMEAGSYNISFDWRANGQSSYDLLNVFLVPENIWLKAGDAYGMNDQLNTYPESWINVSGLLDSKATWSTMDTTILVPGSGNYQLAFFWKNNWTTDIQPPAAVDNVSVSRDSSCMAPINVVMKSVMDVSSVLSFSSYDANETDSWSFKLSTTVIGLDTINTTLANVLDTVITSKSLPVGNLQPSTTYHYYLKSICDVTWVSGTFTTRCAPVALPHAESFDAYGTIITGMDNSFPDCWSRSQNYSTTDNYPLIRSVSPYSAPGALYFRNDDVSYNLAVAPLPDVEHLNKIRLQFKWKGYTNSRLQVGVISDPDDIGTFVALATLSPKASIRWEDVDIYFDDYAGEGKYIAFLNPTGTGGEYPYDLEDVLIDTIPYNRKPTHLEAGNITGSSATLTWRGYEASRFNLKVSSSPLGSTDMAADVFDRTVAASGETLPGLDPLTHYYFYVQGIYTDSVTSEWSEEAVFRTACPDFPLALPFSESFDTYGTGSVYEWDNAFPTCWTRMQNYSTTTGYPYISTTHYSAPGGLEFFTNLSSYEIAISPALDVDPVTGFRLTFKGGKSTLDSRLLVGMISDPADISTFILIDTIFPSATATWEDFDLIIDTGVYAGDAKHLAFYSPVGLHSSLIGYNTFHLDDIRVNCVEKHVFTASVCKAYPYRGYGFDISGEELNTVGTASFRRMVTSDTGCDSIVILNISVGEPTYLELSAEICEGETYTGYGFTETETGRYIHNSQSVTGCDSIVILNLTVLSKFEITETVTICPNSLPYIWHGQEYRNTGVYTDSLKTLTMGCDSIHILQLTVRTADRVTLTENICFGDAFTVGETDYSATGIYVDTLQSSLGCDSIITLNLTVNPVYDLHQDVTICTGSSFTGYGWTDLTLADTYMHRGLSVSGCDSIFTLKLTVVDQIYTTILDTINEGETYNENGFEGITTAGLHTLELKSVVGCDSIVQLVLTVLPVNSVFAPQTETFMLSPNPVEKGSPVKVEYTFNPAEEKGLRIEVFNSVGVCVQTKNATSYPITIENLDTSGIYFVRITTGTNKVLFGKVIVR